MKSKSLLIIFTILTIGWFFYLQNQPQIQPQNQPIPTQPIKPKTTEQPKQENQPELSNTLPDKFKPKIKTIDEQIEEINQQIKTNSESKKAWETYYSRRKTEKQAHINTYTTQTNEQNTIIKNNKKIIDTNNLLFQQLEEQWDLIDKLLKQGSITFEDVKQLNEKNKILNISQFIQKPGTIDETIQTELEAKLNEINVKLTQLNTEIACCETTIRACNTELNSLNFKLGIAQNQLQKAIDEEANLSDKDKELMKKTIDEYTQQNVELTKKLNELIAQKQFKN